MNTLPAPSPSSSDNEGLDLAELGRTLLRHGPLIAAITSATTLIAAVNTLRQKPIWQGNFQIVVNDSAQSRLNIMTANPFLAGLVGGIPGGDTDSIDTQTKILLSPLVLKPVFDSLYQRGALTGASASANGYVAWANNVAIKSIKATSVLEVSYSDSDKSRIIPAMRQIAASYQNYSAKNQRNSIQNSIDWATSQINDLEPIAKRNVERRDRFALDNGIQTGSNLSGGNTDLSTLMQSGAAGGGSKSAIQQLSKAAYKPNDDVASSKEPYAELAAINQKLVERQQIFTPQDPIIQDMIRKRDAIKLYLDRTAGGALTAPRGLPLTQQQSQKILLKYGELKKLADRQESTLEALESANLNFDLEKAKQITPWELISEPILIDQPISPNPKKNLAFGLLFGLAAGSAAALALDRLSGKVFAINKLTQSLPYPLLAVVQEDINQSDQQTLQLLSQGALQTPHSVALIPIGIGISAAQPIANGLQAALREENPRAEVLCSRDLVATSHCSTQILLTACGGPTQTELDFLVHQLQLQGGPVAGWLLLQHATKPANDA